jgi:hypothetical protein
MKCGGTRSEVEAYPHGHAQVLTRTSRSTNVQYRQFYFTEMHSASILGIPRMAEYVFARAEILGPSIKLLRLCTLRAKLGCLTLFFEKSYRRHRCLISCVKNRKFATLVASSNGQRGHLPLNFLSIESYSGVCLGVLILHFDGIFSPT